jgi:dissimilatory sulfite reductase (desulfoviridin) alpha/beta subunit
MGIAFKLNGGMLFLSTEAPGGVYNATQLKKVAQLADTDSLVIKATEDQRLGLFVPLSKVPKIAADLKTVGLGIRHYQDGLHQPVNCAGEFCPENAQDAMGTSIELTKELIKIGALSSPLKIGINGCGRCCVPTHTLDISIIGEPGGYRMSLGGKNSQIPEMASFMAESVPADKVPSLVSKIVELYKKLAQKDESLQDVMERSGTTAFVKVLAPYSQDAHQTQKGEEELSLTSAEPTDPLIGRDDAAFDEPVVGDLDIAVDGEAMPHIESIEESEDQAIRQEPVVDPSDASSDAAMEDLKLDDVELSEDLSLEESPVEPEGSLVETLAEEPLSEEALVEEPLSEEALVEEPLAEEALVEEPLAEEALVEEPLSEEALVEEPLSEEALVEEPLSEEALVEEPLAEASLPEDPLLEDLVPEESLTEGVVETPPQLVATADSPDGGAAPSDLVAEDEFDEKGEEVSDAEADEFEKKIVASIVEEESMAEIDDSNLEDRQDAMKLAEISAEGPSEEALQNSLNPPDDFSNLEIDSDDLEPELMDLESPVQNEEVLEDAQPEQATPAPTRPTLVRESPAAPILQRSQEPALPSRAASTYEVEGIDLDESGRVHLLLTSGAKFSFDTKTFKTGRVQKLKFGGLSISVSKEISGVSIEVDGMSMHLPLQEAA